MPHFPSFHRDIKTSSVHLSPSTAWSQARRARTIISIKGASKIIKNGKIWGNFPKGVNKFGGESLFGNLHQGRVAPGGKNNKNHIFDQNKLFDKSEIDKSEIDKIEIDKINANQN